MIVLALVPLGFALGGAIGDQLGPRATLGIGAIGTLLVGVVLLPSPLWTSDTSTYQPLLKFSVLEAKAKA